MKTLIVGATPSPNRYAYLAAERLYRNGFEFIPIGIRKGELFGQPIQDLRSKPPLKDIHTITLYIGPQNQPEWMEYLLSLNPERIVFNPGTENPEFSRKAALQGANTLEACTLVMIAANQY